MRSYKSIQVPGFQILLNIKSSKYIVKGINRELRVKEKIKRENGREREWEEGFFN